MTLALQYINDLPTLPVCKEEVSPEQLEMSPSLVQVKLGPPQIQEEQQEESLQRPEEAEPRRRAVRYTQDESNVLVQEVEARQIQIFGTLGQPPRNSVVNQAWAEVAATVSASSGIPRSVQQVKKRFADLRRIRKNKVAANRGQQMPAGEGSASVEVLISPEDVAASTLFPESIDGLTDESGQEEVGEDGTSSASGEAPLPETGGEREEEMDPGEAEPRRRAVRYTQAETNVLVHEVKARQIQIFGTSTQPPRNSVVNQAWAEVAAAVTASSGIPRSVQQIKKRFSDMRRMGKRKPKIFTPKVIANRWKQMATGEGSATVEVQISPEDVAASTLSPESVDGFGGFEVGGVTDDSSTEAESGQEEVGEDGTSSASGEALPPETRGEREEEMDPGGGSSRRGEASRPRRRSRRNMDRPLQLDQNLTFLPVCKEEVSPVGLVQVKLEPPQIKEEQQEESLQRPEQEMEPRRRAVRYTQAEKNVLVHEVKARQIQIFGTSTQPPRNSVVNQAWAEVAAAVTASSGIPRSVRQIKKRFADLRRIGKRKVIANRRQQMATGGGSASVEVLISPEEVAASTLFRKRVFEDGGVTDDSSTEAESGQEEVGEDGSSSASCESPPPETGGEREEETDPGGGSPRRREASRPRRRARRNVSRPGDWQFLDIQQAGFRMLGMELGRLADSVERMAPALERCIEVLARSTAALERLTHLGPPPPSPSPSGTAAPPAPPSAAARSRSPPSRTTRAAQSGQSTPPGPSHGQPRRRGPRLRLPRGGR